MALSGRQMMLLKEESSSSSSHAGNGNGYHGGSHHGQGQGQGPGLDPMGESQEYGGNSTFGHGQQQEGLGIEGPGVMIGGAFSPSRGTSPTHHNHLSTQQQQQPLRGQPTHPRFQGNK